MKISNINSAIPTFKGARINIVANSDNHGNLTTLPDFYNAIKQNRKDIFKMADEESTLNLYINVGDYFMNPSKKGWLSHPEKTNGDVQRDFFEVLIDRIRNVVDRQKNEAFQKYKNSTTTYESKHQIKFDALYTPGNHCYDGGDSQLYNLLHSIPSLTTVVSNVDVIASPLFEKELKRENSNFVTSKEYEIPDDKDNTKKHHLLILGATIPAMDFYNPGLLEGTNFVDSNSQKDSKMSKEDIENTIAVIKKKAESFKKKHPHGIIVLASHMGTKLSKMVRDEVPIINEILDGHKHDITTTLKGSTVISSLGMDNNIVKSIALILDDNGDIEEREARAYSSEQYRMEIADKKDNTLKRMLTDEYQKDFAPLIKINGEEPGEHLFDYKANIRYSNSYLANLLTTSIKDSISKIKGEEDIELVGIQSSIIRGGIRNDANNINLMKIFDGVSENLSDVKTGKITGEQLIYLVYENIRDNLKAPERNTIIHWSDLQIDRDGFEELLKQNSHPTIKESSKYIKIRNKKGDFDKIQLSKAYKIAIADKYLKKNDINAPRMIRNKFSSISETYHTLFKKYLESIDYNITINDTYKEQRIITH